jgi:hypothetical protein
MSSSSRKVATLENVIVNESGTGHACGRSMIADPVGFYDLGTLRAARVPENEKTSKLCLMSVLKKVAIVVVAWVVCVLIYLEFFNRAR